jgi:hypothetical protein
MNKIQPEATHAAYDVAKRVYEGQLRHKQGLDILERDYGLNRNSAADYVQDYSCMVEGRLFTRTLNAYAIRYFLQGFLKDGGRSQLLNALSALRQHIEYYEKTGGRAVREGRAIYDQFSIIADSELSVLSDLPRHFIQYWKSEQADRELATEPMLFHSASEQLNRVNVGDVVWIVTLRPQGQLNLIGRLSVGHVTTFEEAKKQLGNVWEATYHVIAESGSEQSLREISLMPLAEELRFISSTQRDRLVVIDGKVDGKQLQSLRQLTPESSVYMERLWSGTSLAAEFEEQVTKGAGFGDPETNKKVELAAIEHVTKIYTSNGWTVESVEAERCGYDLRCRNGMLEEHVEVKGLQGDAIAFIVTRGERKRAERDDAFVLCVVTSILTKQPKLRSYRNEEFLRLFSFDPLAYKAVLIG